MFEFFDREFRGIMMTIVLFGVLAVMVGAECGCKLPTENNPIPTTIRSLSKDIGDTIISLTDPEFYPPSDQIPPNQFHVDRVKVLIIDIDYPSWSVTIKILKILGKHKYCPIRSDVIVLDNSPYDYTVGREYKLYIEYMPTYSGGVWVVNQ